MIVHCSALGLSFGRLRRFQDQLPCPAKLLFCFYLCGPSRATTRTARFGAANASVMGNKEAANSSNMTFTFIDSPRHYPNRSGRRDGVHCLS